MSEPVPTCKAHDGRFSQRVIVTAIVRGFDRAIASYTPGISEVRPHTPCLEIAWLAGWLAACRLALATCLPEDSTGTTSSGRIATVPRVVLHMQLR